MPMEGKVKFCSPRNISGAVNVSQHTTEVDGDLF